MTTGIDAHLTAENTHAPAQRCGYRGMLTDVNLRLTCLPNVPGVLILGNYRQVERRLQQGQEETRLAAGQRKNAQRLLDTIADCES